MLFGWPVCNLVHFAHVICCCWNATNMCVLGVCVCVYIYICIYVYIHMCSVPFTQSKCDIVYVSISPKGFPGKRYENEVSLPNPEAAVPSVPTFDDDRREEIVLYHKRKILWHAQWFEFCLKWTATWDCSRSCKVVSHLVLTVYFLTFHSELLCLYAS